MLRRLQHAQLAVIVCLALASTAWAAPISYSFLSVANPNDTAFTQLLGINNSSTIAGYWGDGTVVPNHGFTLVLPSSFTAENVPLALQTQVIGINNTGWTDGFFVDKGGASGPVTIGFTFNGSKFTPVTSPGTKFNQLLGINDSLTQVGYSSLDPTGMTLQRSYEHSGKTFTYLDGFLPSGVGNNQAVGINNAATVAGFYQDSMGVFHGYLLSAADVLTTLNFPGSMDTSAFGINNNGLVVGIYTDGMGVQHGFTYNTVTNTWQTVDDPVADPGTTLINGLNDKGQLVGFYMSGANTIGFVASPTMSTVPEPGSLLLLGSGILVGLGLFRRKRAR